MLVVISLQSCSAEDGGKAPGPSGPQEATITTTEGIVFGTGEVIDGFPPFNKTDLYAVDNGPQGPQLKTGAAKSVDKGAPAYFFKQGGIARTFDNFDQVPDYTPTDSDDTLLHAKYGNGFVVENYVTGGHTKCWISAVTADSVTIQYEIQ